MNKLLVFVLVLNVLLRYLVSLNGYSGAGKPPMHGDYEAQRHWMEITLNLPPKEWYEGQHPHNDLLYWGLDYPPLTAYVSAAYGYIGRILEPKSMELFTSRGYETPSMLFPAFWLFTRRFYGRDQRTLLETRDSVPFAFVPHQIWKEIILCVLLIQPPLLLIDHGHFQYNGVSLGLTVLAVYSLLTESTLIASIFFVLALNFKQMTLYFAMPFFFYLLGKNIEWKNKSRSVLRIAIIGIVVISTFAILWYPFAFKYHRTEVLEEVRIGDTVSYTRKNVTSATNELGLDGIFQLVHRMFPIGRGLFEDKVANFWCSVDPILKLKKLIPSESMALISLVTTLLCLLPSGLHVMFHPDMMTFLYSMINSSLAFFLFSFQVHEKSILIPLLPISLLAFTSVTNFTIFLSISTAALYSMWNLLYKDGQSIPYVVFLGLMMIAQLYNAFSLHRKQLSTYHKIVITMSILGMLAVHSLEILFHGKTPARFPDLFNLMYSVSSFLHFFLFFLYFNYKQFSLTKEGNIRIKSE